MYCYHLRALGDMSAIFPGRHKKDRYSPRIISKFYVSAKSNTGIVVSTSVNQS